MFPSQKHNKKTNLKGDITMKMKEELNALKEEIEALNKKLSDLTEEEITQVCGGIAPGRKYWLYSQRQSKDGGIIGGNSWGPNWGE